MTRPVSSFAGLLGPDTTHLPRERPCLERSAELTQAVQPDDLHLRAQQAAGETLGVELGGAQRVGGLMSSGCRPCAGEQRELLPKGPVIGMRLRGCCVWTRSTVGFARAFAISCSPGRCFKMKRTRCKKTF